MKDLQNFFGDKVIDPTVPTKKLNNKAEKEEDLTGFLSTKRLRILATAYDDEGDDDTTSTDSSELEDDVELEFEEEDLDEFEDDDRGQYYYHYGYDTYYRVDDEFGDLMQDLIADL